MGRIGLDPRGCDSYLPRWTGAPLAYERTDNLRALQHRLGHAQIESTVRCVGIAINDELAIAGEANV